MLLILGSAIFDDGGNRLLVCGLKGANKEGREDGIKVKKQDPWAEKR